MSAPGLGERLEGVRAQIADAARAAGRHPGELTTIVVTKFHPASLIRELAELGVRDVGESRHQEAKAKADELADLGLTWHFVGQLQSKKARAVTAYAGVIHSVDRASLVDALDAGERATDCFIQVNLTDDAARGGVAPSGLEPLAERVLTSGRLRLLGVMAVAPLGQEPRRAFARLRATSARLTALAPEATAISAGMSEDFAAAIAEGATHLRIGSAITGKRPDRG
ncbi:YggS family pyridoxal phosphate-dependent enzyme [Microbacterium sp. STN6]|uniref:YggS family pyridoxal phosphate-dependent enzyme n=1 Tax=Microbacterium sp. STN6 TaxID=2995588 RepID=UPI002260AC87|nr:YggS family pyridoxal phosphate-dependent enzyme [Microbacterium sp. STN6]MCX7521515.1 YggS family pyridoxal phosphate-dependent enzyme [Microbacterium sp. STN6]